MDSIKSPYSNSYGLSYDNGDISLERSPYIYTPSENDVYHTVKDDETIQNIADQYYQDSGLWGVIADANLIYNPIDEIVPGLQLVIPNGR